MENLFNSIVYLRNSKINKKGDAPIYGRVTLNGARFDVSLQVSCKPKNWDSNKGLVKGNSEEARYKNKQITNFLLKTRKIYVDMVEKSEYLDINQIRDIYTGKTISKRTLLKIFKEHLEYLNSLLGIDYEKATIVKYNTTFKHLSSFLKVRYGKSDIFLQELKLNFIVQFEHYLKVDLQNAQNSTYKHLQRFKRIINIAVENDWLDKDPFKGYSIKKEQKDRGFLTTDELKSLETKEILITRLDEVRDMFVFSCYTGLAYIDIFKLEKSDIKIGIDGEKWIKIKRHKTKTNSMIPILSKALEIIQKYSNHPKVINTERLLPVLTNQKTNAYLKEIADICGINKNLTFHIARHTFATTVTLTNGVPIETVSKMLGHKKITTTQIYSKVVEQKVSYDMQILRDKLEKTQSIRKKAE